VQSGAKSGPVIRFGVFELDLRNRELRKKGARVKLQQQPFDLLQILLERRPDVVTREEIRERLWPVGVHVDFDRSLNKAVVKLREALGDDAESPRFVETLPRHGYRFIAPVATDQGPPELAEEPTPAGTSSPPVFPPVAVRDRRFPVAIAVLGVVLGSAWLLGRPLWRAPGGIGRSGIHSLAVLPLQNLSGDPSQNYFADGITDELTTDLARIGSLRVISRTSTMRYADHPKPMSQIVKDLNVDAVIEGSVVRAGNRVRITAQLIDARHDAHLWAQSYERDLGEILELQASVALDIAGQVRANLSIEERGVFQSHRAIKPEAYEAYLRGRNEIGKQTQDSLRNSVPYFQRAIDLDPLYAGAYAGLADSFTLLANYAVLPPNEVFPRAEAAARKAIELEPSLGEAHASLAFVRHHFDWDWSGAEAEYKRALQLSPGLPQAHLRYAEYLSNAGRHEEALREINRARDLDPLSLTAAGNVGRVLFYARRYDDTIREMRSMLVLNPDRIYARIYLAMAYLQKHMYAEAIAEFERVDAIRGEPGVGLGEAYALAGRAKEAEHVLRELEAPSSSGTLDWVFIAGVYAALGDKDQAFAWLEKAYDNRDFFMTYLGVDPWLDPLRSDPRFGRLMASARIPAGR
jgi:TolB-like protein/DNA-binding winged helix-turn-helix (wHTH) protein/cytochrome c-type biogenesis protein CcmH/NrfG